MLLAARLFLAKKIKSMRKAMTLTELLVATIVLAVVIFGIASVDYAIRNMNQQSSDYLHTVMDMQTAMLKITKDASLAVGDATDCGIKTYYNGSDTQSVCFRHDQTDPNSYADDQWVCYFHGSNYLITRYQGTCAVNVPPTTVGQAAACGAVQLQMIQLPVSVSYSQFASVYYESGAEMNNNCSEAIDRIEIRLASRPDPNQAAHPINNPEKSMETTISPAGLGR